MKFWLINWLIHLLYYNQYCTLLYNITTNIVPRTTNSHFHFHFELVSLQIHSHYTAQDHWLLHFPHRLSLSPTHNHLIMVLWSSETSISFSIRELCWKFSLLRHFDMENDQIRSRSFDNNSLDSADFRHHKTSPPIGLTSQRHIIMLEVTLKWLTGSWEHRSVCKQNAHVSGRYTGRQGMWTFM